MACAFATSPEAVTRSSKSRERDRAAEGSNRPRRVLARGVARLGIGPPVAAKRVRHAEEPRRAVERGREPIGAEAGGDTETDPVGRTDVSAARREARALDAVAEAKLRLAVVGEPGGEDPRVGGLAEERRHLGPAHAVHEELERRLDAALAPAGHERDRRAGEPEALEPRRRVAAPDHLVAHGLAVARAGDVPRQDGRGRVEVSVPSTSSLSTRWQKPSASAAVIVGGSLRSPTTREASSESTKPGRPRAPSGAAPTRSQARPRRSAGPTSTPVPSSTRRPGR